MKLTKAWSPFDPKVGYEKEMQDIKLKDGTEISMCWPNAGIFVCCCNNEQPDTPAENVAYTRLTHHKNWYNK